MQQASRMVLSGSALNASETVTNGFAFGAAAAGELLDEALVLAEQIAVHQIPALVANERFIGHGREEAIAQAWSSERAAMLEMADQIGPIGWKVDS
jgi:enoyl-CoA hydratase/carnithine racemase